MALIENPRGGYAFLRGSAPYSSGAAALPGFALVRATLQRPLPYRAGFALIGRHLSGLGRPWQALAGIELRSPAPWTMDGFHAFNAGYQDLLAELDLPVGGLNPVARTNVAPLAATPAEPSLYAFSYTVPSADPGRSFVTAGSGELTDDGRIIRPGEDGPDALREKATYVMGVMQQRIAGLGATMADVTAVDLYTIHSPLSYLDAIILAPLGPAAIHAFHWCLSRPPVVGLEFEMDVRGVRQEIRVG